MSTKLLGDGQCEMAGVMEIGKVLKWECTEAVCTSARSANAAASSCARGTNQVGLAIGGAIMDQSTAD